MKKVLSIICLLLTPVFFMGCGKTADKKENVKNIQAEEKTVESPKTESDDLYSFEISLDGKSYKLPTAYSEFEKDGWGIEGKGDGGQVLKPGQYTVSQVMKNGDDTIYVQLVNSEPNELPLKECKVGAVRLDRAVKKETKFALPKGIGFDSTKDDVIKAYGNPSNTNETSTQTTLNYEVGSYSKVKIIINKESGKIESIEVQNLADKAGKSSSANNGSNSEVPESAANYKTPTELTDDPLNFNAKYDGVLYHMPAPFIEFEKNGWVIQEGPKEDVPARKSITGVTLRKGNQILKTNLYNDSAKATNARNCFVTVIIQDVNSTQVPLELPKGITVGSTKADLEAAYAGINVKKSEASGLEFYSYSKKALQQVEIVIKKDTGKISKIKVEYLP